jgi:competence protein ComEA
MKRLASLVLCCAAFACALPLVYAGPVNINSADAETLALELSGVGPALARAIVEDREKNGRFESPEALMRVSGVGERILENNREFIRIDDARAGP